MLSQSVIDDINAACSAKRVLRDAFLDCALYYFTERLYEAVVVIKNPRNTRDLVSQIASVLNDPREELTEEDRRRFIVETIEEWAQPRRLERFSGDFYREEMSWDATRVADEKTKQELFLDFEPRDPEKVAERLDANDKSNRGTA